MFNIIIKCVCEHKHRINYRFIKRTFSETKRAPDFIGIKATPDQWETNSQRKNATNCCVATQTLFVWRYFCNGTVKFALIFATLWFSSLKRKHFSGAHNETAHRLSVSFPLDNPWLLSFVFFCKWKRCEWKKKKNDKLNKYQILYNCSSSTNRLIVCVFVIWWKNAAAQRCCAALLLCNKFERSRIEWKKSLSFVEHSSNRLCFCRLAFWPQSRRSFTVIVICFIN